MATSSASAAALPQANKSLEASGGSVSQRQKEKNSRRRVNSTVGLRSLTNRVAVAEGSQG
jgi:hypothetical protein